MQNNIYTGNQLNAKPQLHLGMAFKGIINCRCFFMGNLSA